MAILAPHKQQYFFIQGNSNEYQTSHAERHQSYR